MSAQDTSSPRPAPDLDREKITEAIRQVLLAQGLPPGAAEISLRSYGGTDGKVPALLVLVRLNQWSPQALLASKVIEKRVRDALWRQLQVRIGYVFWRIGSEVSTPFDHLERFPAVARRDRVEPLVAQAAAAGAKMPPSAPVTDWTDLDAPGEAAAPVPRKPQR
ncbi:hypothetical protein M8A51_03605 [Schlegelella sp. S2-27]|uniref:Ribosome-binding factor A n=1 Tax=Caldimonas mangrovi TaxID=2944811 RepID=A0ABT0YIU3_9BURK|nr:hypothetical protein [Caldimonas mangrovi]MCM5678615.1 hypothetical protein [Caldimonas mangrovi]